MPGFLVPVGGLRVLYSLKRPYGDLEEEEMLKYDEHLGSRQYRYTVELISTILEAF